MNFVMVPSMKFPKYIFPFAWRLLSREWGKYTLAFLSLLVTSVTFTVVLVSVDGARNYLSLRTQEFLGGDLVFESGTPIDIEPYVASLAPLIAAQDRETSLSLSVRVGENVTGVSARAITESYPLYGTLLIEDEPYRFPDSHEVYVERSVLERLDITVGQELKIGTVGYAVRGVILEEPDALVQGFRFAPRMILSEAGFLRAGIVLSESRSEYEYRFRLADSVPRSMLEPVIEKAREAGLDVRYAGDGRSGFLSRLENVERFFLVTVLIGAVLSVVNVYANALALVTRLRKSFAVFLVEGASKRSILLLVLGIIGALTTLATVAGILLGLFLVSSLHAYIEAKTGLSLSLELHALPLLLVLLGTLATSLAASFPAMRDLLSLDPRILLGMGEGAGEKRSSLLLIGMTGVSFLPLFFLAGVLLGRYDWAGYVVAGTLVLFVLMSILVKALIDLLYRIRFRFSFFFRTIIAERHSDGLFGVIATASLLVALSSIFTLMLLERSLEQFFESGLSETVPSAYVIDVQKDQLDLVREAVPNITLFPNVRARILRIDDRMIQDRLATQETSASGGENRELSREFNLTYRTSLLSSEAITSGTWQGEKRGEVSVQDDFAKQVGIRLGSTINFFIQGVRLTVVVTSLRSTDTTSGLPFFYFVLHPDDLAVFPASSFGYVDVSTEELRAIERRLATVAPNVSVLDTTALRTTVVTVSRIILLILGAITFPPLLLALLLLVSLVAMTFAGRERDALRLQVLGATRARTLSLFLSETALTVLVVSVLGTGIAIGVVTILTRWFLTGVTAVYVTTALPIFVALLLGGLVTGVLLLSLFLRRSLSKRLSYEDNV